MQRRTFSLTGFSKSIIPQIAGLIGLCGVLIIYFSASVRAEEQGRSANFIISGFTAIDLRSGVKWMRVRLSNRLFNFIMIKPNNFAYTVSTFKNLTNRTAHPLHT